jgi:hypothetical protein
MKVVSTCIAQHLAYTWVTVVGDDGDDGDAGNSNSDDRALVGASSQKGRGLANKTKVNWIVSETCIDEGTERDGQKKVCLAPIF